MKDKIYNLAPYSISKMGTYYQCPMKFKLQYIDKIRVPFTSNVALLKGSHIHKILEHNFDYNTPFKTNEIYTESHVQTTKEIVQRYENSDLGILTKKLIQKGTLEENFAFDLDGNLVNYRSRNAFFRGSADLYGVHGKQGFIIDYKSGKDKSNVEDFGTDQAKMYALYLFLKFPDIDSVKSTFFFIEHNTKKTYEYTKDKVSEYMQYFKDKTLIIENDKTYRKQESALCEYCDFYHHKHCTGQDSNTEVEDFMNSKIVF